MCNVKTRRLSPRNAMFTQVCCQKHTSPQHSFGMLLYYLLFFSIPKSFLYS